MKSIVSSSNNPCLNLRLAAYATAGAAAAGVTAAPSARAAIVYSGPLNIAVPFNNAGIYLDLVTNRTSTIPFAGYDIQIFYTGSKDIAFLHELNGGFVIPTGSDPFNTPASALTAGAFIGSTSTINSNTSGTNFEVTGTEYLGIRFNNTATQQVDYGWILLSTNAPQGNPATILGYAYNNTAGGSILAGQVPEPGTTAMLGLGTVGLGAAGLRAWRRRQQAA